MVELVTVIVIIGVLTAAALPVFVDMGRDARIDSVKAMEGTLRVSAELLHSVCVINPRCAGTSGFFYLNYLGRTLLINNGYPESGDVIGGDQIDTIITYSGFDVSLPNNLSTRFTKQGAQNPATCSVTYIQAASLGAEPVITTDITGC